MLDDVEAYIQHTIHGVPMRELARQHRVHASTVMRKVRRVEDLRENPLYNLYFEKDWNTVEERLDKLELLAKAHAFVAVAKKMDMAVIMRGDSRLGAVEALVVSNWLVWGWIKEQHHSAQIHKYTISQKGLARIEQQSLDEHTSSEVASRSMPAKSPRPRLNEIPVQVLARRRGKDGQPFLSRNQLDAAARLYEDFMHTIEGDVKPATINWDELGMKVDRTPNGNIIPESWFDGKAATGFEEAMKAMGSGLSDILLLVVCHELGLEEAEKRLGWSARSGKIVLSIALEHLASYYSDLGPALIG